MYTNADTVRRALAPDGVDQGNSDSYDQSTAASMDDAALNDAIAEACSTIDSYIGGRYQVPVTLLAAVPPATDGLPPDPISFWARTIAAYLATLTWRRNQPLTADDPIQLRFNAVMLALVAVRDGKNVLPGLTPSEDGTGTTSVVVGVNMYEGTLFCPSDVLTPTMGDPWPVSSRGSYWRGYY